VGAPDDEFIMVAPSEGVVMAAPVELMAAVAVWCAVV